MADSGAADDIEKQILDHEAKCDTVLRDIASIKEQIGRAKARAQGDRIYADSDWYQSANRALRHKQIEHQRLLREGAAMRRKLKKSTTPSAEELTFERTFMREAKAILDGSLYSRIIERTIAVSESEKRP
ncbi:hypothetical protein ACQUFY_04550 [Robbsia andropogonis]|uniref:hypothetical protein n=1 Tax=Robbsia andropogonis TaxID=28092 RepID=UPI003D23D847